MEISCRVELQECNPDRAPEMFKRLPAWPGRGTPSAEESELQQEADNLPTPTSRAGTGRDTVTHELYRPTHVAVRFRA